MLPLLALALAAVDVVPDSGRPRVHRGEFLYTPRVAEAVPGATEVLCDTVEVSGGVVDFRQRQWDAHTRFLGRWQGDVLTVTAIQPRNERRSEAHGSCRIDRLNGRISMVSCAAVSRGRDWVANFRHVLL
jgi:hypothetical protein